MKAWIAQYAPGTKLAITEYAWDNTDDQGHELDARFMLERATLGVDLVIASRGGAGKSTPGGRNIHYEKAVEILLGRLARWQVVLDGVSVDSSVGSGSPR